MKFRTISIFALIGVMLWLVPVLGQNAVESPEFSGTLLTLAQAESIAASRNYDLRIAHAQYEQAAANYLAAWSSFLPVASFSAGWRRYSNEIISIRNDQFIRSRDSYSLGISASFPLFSGGKDLIALRQAKLSRDIAWLTYKDTREQIHFNLIQAYFSFVRAAMEYEIAKQSLARAQDEQKIVQKKFELGGASEMDISKMRVQVAQKQFSLTQARNEFDRARENLCALLSFPLDTLIYPDTTYLPRSAGEIPPVENYIDRYKHNRDWLNAFYNLKISKLEKLSSFLSYLPKLTLSGNWGWSGGDTPQTLAQLKKEGSSSFGISISWTLFSGTSRIAELKRSAARLVSAKNSLSKSTITVEQQIREAYRMMIEAVESYNVAQVQIEDAKLTLEATKKRYELGSATLLELLDAELTLEQAQLQRVNAIANYYIQRAKLEWLTSE